MTSFCVSCERSSRRLGEAFALLDRINRYHLCLILPHFDLLAQSVDKGTDAFFLVFRLTRLTTSRAEQVQISSITERPLAFERCAAFHDIEDYVRKPDHRTKFNRTVELDDLDRAAARSKNLPCDTGVFGRNTNVCFFERLLLSVTADADAALAESEIQHFI